MAYLSLRSWGKSVRGKGKSARQAICATEPWAVVAALASGVAFADGKYGAVSIRSATLMREVSTGARSIGSSVTVAESTRARAALARAILLRSAVRLAVLVLGVAGIVWIAVTLALRPLDRLGAMIAECSPDDLRPVTADTPQEVEVLIRAICTEIAALSDGEIQLQNGRSGRGLLARVRLAIATIAAPQIRPSVGPSRGRCRCTCAGRSVGQHQWQSCRRSAGGDAMDRNT